MDHAASRPLLNDATALRVRGLVQGVGFRPTVWRLARELGLLGDVRNDGEGVLIRACRGPSAPADALDQFKRRLLADCPPLARIDRLEYQPVTAAEVAECHRRGDFLILASAATLVRTGIVPDAATCPACRAEIRDPDNRRFRYPFANCTHCGPRLSIVRAIPYDRANTSMQAFPLCAACASEYADPADRRFHAQPTACADCGPRLWLVDGQGVASDAHADAIAVASRQLAAGAILALKGIGGFHLACDATSATAVAALRQRKGRFDKPFALMARDLEVIRAYAQVTPDEAAALQSPAAPILLLRPRAAADPASAPPLAPGVAPGQTTLGFMLPYSPPHHLLLADWDRPLVMTSGNLSEEPQCIDNAEAQDRLAGLADAWLLHDRPILNRVDDSVAQHLAGAIRVLRRARGYAPAPLNLPPGFADCPPVLACGGELKNTFCLTRAGVAILSQHLGDLEEARTAAEYARTLALYGQLFAHQPRRIAVDAHPDYRASQLGRAWAAREQVPLIEVQHHHAHLAAVLAEHAWPLDAPPVLGIALDGLGYGSDGTLWGGELLLTDYRRAIRLAHLKPVALPGGEQAVREPWRNLFAHCEAAGGWERLRQTYTGIASLEQLADRPLPVLRTMIERGLNAPLSSSAGRLFDAVAAALGVCGERQTYEGQAAIALETLAAPLFENGEADRLSGYPFAAIARPGQPWLLDPTPLWQALLSDLARRVPRERVAARMHLGLSEALAALAQRLAREASVDTVALSGGVFHNRLLLEHLSSRLTSAGLRVLLHRQVPTNDGGLSLGQAAIAAAATLEQ